METKKYDEIFLGDGDSVEEINQFILPKLNDSFCSYDYAQTHVKRRRGMKFPEVSSKNLHLRNILLYCNIIARSVVINDDISISDTVYNEIKHWDTEGKYCYFLSVLAACLLYEEGIFCVEQLSLLKGFYRYATDNPFLTEFTNIKTSSGLHAWLEIDGSILDFAISVTESGFITFETPFVIGFAPKNIEYWGYSEPFNTIKKYARHFAKYAKMNYYDWIAFHRKTAIKVVAQLQ